MIKLPFQPAPGQTFTIANATSSSAGRNLPPECGEIVLYNSSATATAFFRITATFAESDTPQPASATTDMPVPPGQQIRVHVGIGIKEITAIASAADGNLYVTPGNGY